ncbi:hypothetical protein DYQ05_09385 [Treponema pedis]|nr:hypothetical protein DYQ05_09385 [Treponema pedis]
MKRGLSPNFKLKSLIVIILTDSISKARKSQEEKESSFAVKTYSALMTYGDFHAEVVLEVLCKVKIVRVYFKTLVLNYSLTASAI